MAVRTPQQLTKSYYLGLVTTLSFRLNHGPFSLRSSTPGEPEAGHPCSLTVPLAHLNFI